jgi:hypothetical protein
MKPERVHPLPESHIDAVIESAGGKRAHSDSTKRTKHNADYRLGSAIIELKMLNEEGFDKPERQNKLAKLFRTHFPSRPVIVLDRTLLPTIAQSEFDRIIEGPIKTGVSKANAQLKQSRTEHPDCSCSVLLVVNNSYTTLNHDALRSLVSHRVRQDTSGIDAVVIAGAYYHSDSFDNFYLWPMEYISVNLNRPFREFNALREAWQDLANRFMSDIARGRLQPSEWTPVADTQFEIDHVTYVRPAPAMGMQSEFYINGRPRHDSANLKQCPHIATVFPYLTQPQWSALNQRLGAPSQLMGSYEAWRTEQAAAERSSQPRKPLVTIPVTVTEWEAWCRSESVPENAQSVFNFALKRFNEAAHARLLGARERDSLAILPSRYIYVVTEVIGQDKANDVSHIARITERLEAEPIVESIVEDSRIRHEHALALGAAYAVRESIETLVWSRDLNYAWI